MSFRKLVSFIAPLMIASLFLVSNTEAATTGSLVYIKNHDVWLSDPDGTDAHRVTTSGDEDSPWRSPSQADDGTIAASFGTRIVRMEQNGEVLSSIDPSPLMNSVSHPQDGVPVDVAISPNGKVIAWTYYTYECPIGVECGGRYGPATPMPPRPLRRPGTGTRISTGPRGSATSAPSRAADTART